MAKLMVVDDALFMRAQIKELVQPFNFQIIEAANGKEAVEKFKQEQPDIITMDITMPEMDGISAAKHILALSKQMKQKVKIVMVSSAGQAQNVKETILSGARDFVVKPVNPQRFHTAITRLMA